MATRKPYIRKSNASWWLKRGVYIRYMVRESSAFFSLWLCIELLIFASITAYDAPNAPSLITNFLAHPAAIAANIAALLALLFHTITWYTILPEGIRCFMSRKPDDTRLIPRRLISIAGALMTLIASAIILCALIFG